MDTMYKTTVASNFKEVAEKRQFKNYLQSHFLEIFLLSTNYFQVSWLPQTAGRVGPSERRAGGR